MHLVIATGPGNLPAVWVLTANKVGCDSSHDLRHQRLVLGGPNRYPYMPTGRICQVWLYPSVPISGYGFMVFLFVVKFGNPTVNCKLLNLACHCQFWFIGCFCNQITERHAPYPFLKMRVNWVWLIFSLGSLVSGVVSGCRHSFIRYWSPV